MQQGGAGQGIKAGGGLMWALSKDRKLAAKLSTRVLDTGKRSFTFYFYLFIYFERETERESKHVSGGEAEGKGERENPMPTPHSAQSLMRGSIPRP